jgi:hypothetical protein
MEVALSLKKRQHYPLWLGFLFWNYHIRSLIEQLETEKTLFVDFNLLCGASYEEEIERMASFFSIKKPKKELVEIFNGIFNKKFKHHEADRDTNLPSETKKLWEQLVLFYKNQT